MSSTRPNFSPTRHDTPLPESFEPADAPIQHLLARHVVFFSGGPVNVENMVGVLLASP